ncbi:MAG: preprotein translocase subunit SecE [Oscillospiraceae bacterium]|nr:preprotein translocase subunit SecE [Oscillospiraceae bacterium]
MSEEKKIAPEQKPEKKAKKKKPGGNRVSKWFRELRSELKKVSWPSRAQIINNTWVVLVVTCVCAVAIWGFDYISGQMVSTLIRFFGSGG